MTLAEKYVILFQNECLELSNIVLNNLQKLTINPENKDALEKMLQAADTIIGDSRFINNKELEQASTLLANTFNADDNMNYKSKELAFFTDVFTKIIYH